MIAAPENIQKGFGILAIPDEILEDALKRVRVRVAALDLSPFKRIPAQARIEIESVEAIVGTFRDHFPGRDVKARSGWPHVVATLKGSRATIEVWLGHDYDTGDGIEPFDVIVNRGPQKSNFIERLKERLAHRPTHEPELLLSKAPEPEKPKTPEPEKSRARSILDAKKG